MDNPWGKGLGSQILGLNGELEQQLAGCTAELREKTDQLCAMAVELAQVKQHEREQLAAILHDNLQQLLVAACIQIRIVGNVLLPIKERNALFMANDIVEQAITVSRGLTVDLSPPILHGVSLGAALPWLVRRMAEQHCFTVNLRFDPHAEPETESLRILLFETVRELLFNSCKHSGCTTVRVNLTRRQDGCIGVVVEDAGKGFDPETLGASRPRGETGGLFGIQRRLTSVGGRMSVVSRPGAGTRVEIVMPVANDVQTVQPRQEGQPERVNSFVG